MATPEDKVHVCVGRNDVPHGLRHAMWIHCAGESGALAGDLILEDVLTSAGARPDKTTYAVALVGSQEDLVALEAVLKDKGFHHVAIREDEGGFAGQLMAIGLVPCKRADIQPHIAHLQPSKK